MTAILTKAVNDAGAAKTSHAAVGGDRNKILEPKGDLDEIREILSRPRQWKKATGDSMSRADPVRDRALFEVALGRGLRASEVGLLDLKHLRLKDNRLFVTRLKGGRTGEYLISDREVRALKPYLRQRGWLQGPLFPSRNRRPISRRRLDELMKFYGERAGLSPEKRHFHCMRHTCATRLLDQGVRVEEVQDILGHEDIRNTMIYAKITNPHRIEVGARIRESW